MQKPLGLGESILTAWFVWTAMGCYTSLSVWFIDRDMRKLSPERLERAWSPVQFAAAIFGMMQLGFPQIAIVTHFVRTRRSLWGLLLGLFWAALTYLPIIALAAILEAWLPDT